MNRQDFCEMLAEAKGKSGLTTTDIIFETKTLFNSIHRIELGLSNFNIPKLLQYLQAIQHHLVIINKRKRTVIADYEQLLEYITKLRTKQGSTRVIAKLLNWSATGITNIEKQRTKMTIDYLLSLCELCGVTVKIEKDD